MMSKPSPADAGPALKRAITRRPAGAAAVGVLAAGVLALAALACSQPYNVNDLSGTGANGGAYFVCRTATPVPTVTYVYNERTATPNALGTPQAGLDYDTGFTTPVPTETPFYRQGTFHRDQGAIVSGRFEIFLDATGGSGEYATATWRIRNRGADAASLILSIQTFMASAAGPVYASATGAETLGLNPAETLDRRPIPAGGEDTRTYAYAIAPGAVTNVGLTTGWIGGGGGQTMYFTTAEDPAVLYENACAHGPADWLSVDGMGGGSLAPQIAGLADGDRGQALPPPGPGKGYATRPGGALGGGGPISAPYRVASGYLEGGHHGLDLTPCHLVGCQSTADVPADQWILRLGPGKPIRAAMGGVIHRVNCEGWNFGYGCYVVIRTEIGPDDYLYTFYAHMQPWQTGNVWRTGISDPTCDPSNCGRTTLATLGLAPALLSRGSEIRCGQVLGYVGMTGNTSGPHLHWEVRRGGLQPFDQTPSIGNQVDPDQTRPYWTQTCGVTYTAIEDRNR